MYLDFATLQIVCDNYSSQQAECGPDQEVIFKEDEITLSIPDEGLTLQNGWTITPLMHPGVRFVEF